MRHAAGQRSVRPNGASPFVAAYLELAIFAVVGGLEDYVDVLGIGQDELASSQVELGHEPAAEHVAGAGFAFHGGEADALEKMPAVFWFEQARQQVPPGLQAHPRQVHDGLVVGELEQCPIGVADLGQLRPNQARVDHKDRSEPEQRVGRVGELTREPHGNGEVGQDKRPHDRRQVGSGLASNVDVHLLEEHGVPLGCGGRGAPQGGAGVDRRRAVGVGAQHDRTARVVGAERTHRFSAGDRVVPRPDDHDDRQDGGAGGGFPAVGLATQFG